MVEYIGLADLIETAKKKTLIFTSYVQVVDKSFEYLTNLGFKPLRVYGDTNSELPNIVKRFDSEIDINPVIATFKSLSTAVPLTMANRIIMLNMPFRQHEYDQAVARCDRLGQDSEVDVFNIILDTGDKKNISSRNVDIMSWSKNQVDQILGIDSTAVDDDISLESSSENNIMDYLHELDISIESIIENEMMIHKQKIYSNIKAW
jgi:superfamily II DNA/RNA helicase